MPILKHCFHFDAAAKHRTEIPAHWDSCRYSFRGRTIGDIFVILPLPRLLAAGTFQTFSRTFQAELPVRYNIKQRYFSGIRSALDCFRETVSAQLQNRFDLKLQYRDFTGSRFDCVRFINGSIRYTDTYDIFSLLSDSLVSNYDAVTNFPHSKNTGLFRISAGGIRHKALNRLDVLRYWIKDGLPNCFCINAHFKDFLTNRFAAFFTLDEHLNKELSRNVFFFDILNRRLFREHVRFDSLNTLLPQIKAGSLFNTVQPERAGFKMNRRAFIRSGWKIFARNLSTGVLQELGFIETENSDRSLSNIFLPDGDYEISVLTSSLFWKDALDRTVHTISIHDGAELSPLPVIYNLRSSVSQGVTTIQWSANQSEIDDCVFGLWYSSDSTVDTNRPPDETVWYFPAQSEYIVTFQQREKSILPLPQYEPATPEPVRNPNSAPFTNSFLIGVMFRPVRRTM
jgi:hypothetical protein